MKKINFKELSRDYRKYVEKDIWKQDLTKLRYAKRLLIQSAKVILLAYKGFVEDKCQVRASALTFFSLLSVVPVIALAFAISKGFGLEQVLEDTLKESLSGHDEVIKYILDFSRQMLNTTKGGVIAGVGIVVLLFSVMRLLNSVENAFNAMWDVKRARSFSRKFTDYLSIMLFAPVLLILSSSATVFISTYLTSITAEYKLLGYASPLISFLIRCLPYVLIWLLFTLIYIIMPNTKVNFKSAFIAGIVGGSAFQLLQWGYIKFQVGAGSYGAIYGSFAALPLFLVWLQLSWLIILLGGEISYAVQNANRYRVERGGLEISPAYRKQLTMLILHKIIRRFVEAEPPLTIANIADDLHIPQRYVRQLVSDLSDVNILAEIRAETENHGAFIPAVDVNLLTMNYVLTKLENKGNDEITISKTDDYKRIKQTLDSVNDKLSDSEAAKLIKDI